MYDEYRIKTYFNILSKNAKDKEITVELPENLNENGSYILFKKCLDDKKTFYQCAKLYIGPNNKDARSPVFLTEIKYIGRDFQTRKEISNIILKTNLETRDLMWRYSNKERSIISGILNEITGPPIMGEKNTLYYSARNWEKETDGANDTLVLENEATHSITKFSSAGAESNGQSLIDSFKCTPKDDGSLKFSNKKHHDIIYNALFHSTNMSYEESEENRKIIKNMEDGHRYMFYKNVPSDMDDYVPVEKYERMVNATRKRSNEINKHEQYYNQNLEDLRKQVKEYYDKNLNVRFIIDSASMITGDNHVYFINKLKYEDIKTLFKDKKYINIDKFNMNISSKNIFNEIKSLCENSKIFPLKYKNGEINTDLLMPEYQRERLDVLLKYDNKNLDIIKERYDGLSAHGKNDPETINKFKHASAMCVSRMMNNVYETCPNLIGRVLVTDVVSSAVWDRLDLKEPNGRKIRMNTIDLDESDKSQVLDIEEPIERIEAYTDLMLGIGHDEGGGNDSGSENNENEDVDHENGLEPNDNEPKKPDGFGYDNEPF